MADEITPMLTPDMWRRNPDATTPSCPCCGQSLGIRPGVWRMSGRDAWLCQKCGEWESIMVPAEGTK